MTILSTVYASAPAAEVLIPTLEIRHPGQSVLTCVGYEDFSFVTRGLNLVSGWVNGWMASGSTDEQLSGTSTDARTTQWFSVDPDAQYVVDVLSGGMDSSRTQWRLSDGTIIYDYSAALNSGPGKITSPPQATECRIYYASAFGVVGGDISVRKEQLDEFAASGLDVSLPKRDASGQQNLNFAIENVTGQAQQFIDDALEAGQQIDAIYREYLASDPAEPAAPPLEMVVVGAKMQGSTLHVTASYQDIIGQAWPRVRYSAEFAPGLRYI